MPPLEMSLKAMNAPYPLAASTYFHKFGASKPMTTPVPQKGGRRVQFIPHVMVRHIMHRNEYSREEVETSWYTKTEIRDMKRKCKQEAAQVTASDYEKEQMSVCNQQERPLTDITNTKYHYEGVESTVRGLESKTEMGSLRKKRHRLQAWSAVFAEQRWQSMQGYSDPETLADVYFDVSEPCHVGANMVGMRDAQLVLSMDQWEQAAELEKENQKGIWTNESSGDLEGSGRRYQRLIAFQQRDQNQRLVLSSAA
jgi:hypothetical protein